MRNIVCHRIILPALVLLTLAAGVTGCNQAQAKSSLDLPELANLLEEGDIIFQQSMSSQSTAIQQATGSRWTHVAIVVKEGGRTRILEAAGRGVAFNSLEAFVEASEGRKVSVSRLRDSQELLTPQNRSAVRAALERDMGKRYDRLFEWSDTTIYCSELIWRAFDTGMGISVGEVQVFSELDYRKPAVLELIQERKRLSGKDLEDSTLLREKIITPVAIKESPLLTTVFEGKVR